MRDMSNRLTRHVVNHGKRPGQSLQIYAHKPGLHQGQARSLGLSAVQNWSHNRAPARTTTHRACGFQYPHIPSPCPGRGKTCKVCKEK